MIGLVRNEDVEAEVDRHIEEIAAWVMRRSQQTEAKRRRVSLTSRSFSTADRTAEPDVTDVNNPVGNEDYGGGAE